MMFLLVYRNHFFLRFSSIVRVTWSRALALDCIPDILCIQFVQKTRGVDVLFPPFLGRRRLLSRKRMRDAVPSCLQESLFSSILIHSSRHLVPCTRSRKMKPSIRVLPHLKKTSRYRLSSLSSRNVRIHSRFRARIRLVCVMLKNGSIHFAVIMFTWCVFSILIVLHSHCFW